MTDLRKDCRMRHKIGNCTVIGGFCTAVSDPICEGLHNAYDLGYQDAALRAQQERENPVPLTIAELRGMVGEPVWIVTERLKEWCIVHSYHLDDVIGGEIIVTRRTAEKRVYSYTDKGKTWLAYRHKPEEGTI